MATSAPVRANSRAMARPMRRAPPVMSTDLPLRGCESMARAFLGLRRGRTAWLGLFRRRLGRSRRCAGVGRGGVRCRWRRCAGVGLGGVGQVIVILVDGILLAGALELDFDGHVKLVNLEVFAIGLEAAGDDLEADHVTQGENVDNGLAVFVGLQLHGACVAFALHGVKHDGGVLNGLAIGIAQNGDLDAGGRWGGLVLAGAVRTVILSRKRERSSEEAEAGREDAETIY